MTIYQSLKHRYAYFAVVILALIICIFYKSNLNGMFEESPSHKSYESTTVNDSSHAGGGSSNIKNVDLDNNKIPVGPIISASGFSPAEMNQIHDWFSAHGNFMFDAEQGQYASYGMETLKQLSESGDVRALHELAKLYLSKEHAIAYGFDAAAPLYWKAAIYGSTHALNELGVVTDAKYRFGLYSEEERRQANLEVLSLYAAAALRGDKWGILVYQKSNMSSSVITLTEADNEFINKRSHEIINQIQQSRYEMGMRAFDNDVPESVKHFFDVMSSTVEN